MLDKKITKFQPKAFLGNKKKAKFRQVYGRLKHSVPARSQGDLVAMVVMDTVKNKTTLPNWEFRAQNNQIIMKKVVSKSGVAFGCAGGVEDGGRGAQKFASAW